MNYIANIDRFVTAINEKFADEHTARYPGLLPDTHAVEYGRKFAKITQTNWIKNGEGIGRGQTFVHAFVNIETGDVIKAAGWTAPQKSKTHPSGFAVRFNIATEDGYAEAVDAADMHGGYLYNS